MAFFADGYSETQQSQKIRSPFILLMYSTKCEPHKTMPIRHPPLSLVSIVPLNGLSWRTLTGSHQSLLLMREGGGWGFSVSFPRKPQHAPLEQ